MLSSMDVVGESLIPVFLLVASVLAQLSLAKIKSSSTSTIPTDKKDTLSIKSKIPSEMYPCENPPAGLGLGKEDPVVAMYVKDRLEDASWTEIPSKVNATVVVSCACTPAE